MTAIIQSIYQYITLKTTSTSNICSNCPVTISPSEIPLLRESQNQDFQEVLDAFYKAPLPHPDDITVTNLSGQEALWISLSELEQQRVLEKNKRGVTCSVILPYEGPAFCEESIPRWTHGCMHASRVAVEVEILANLYQKYDPSIRISEEELLLAQYLAVFHDSARQAEGVDLWDDDSAENARPYLLTKGFSQEATEKAIQLLKDKDSSDPNRNIISKLIHDADCLDIMRVYGLKKFKQEKLEIHKQFNSNPSFLKKLKDLKNEIYKWIKRTEDSLFKLNLEKYSNTYFKQVRSTLGVTVNKIQMFPNLLKFISHPIDKCLKRDKAFVLRKDEQTASSPILKSVKQGVNESYIKVDNDFNVIFYKKSHYLSCLAEEAASRITSMITANLVPVATAEQKEKPSYVEQEYKEIHKGIFSSKSFVNNQVNFDLMSIKQIEQLFTHMLADKVVSNYDAHSGQFRIDIQGNVVSYDKGQSFRFFGENATKYFGREEPDSFDPKFQWPPLNNDTPVYPAFCQYLKLNPSVLQNIIDSETVQNAFNTIKSITKEDFKKDLEKYAIIASKDDPEAFYSKVYQRAQDLEESVKGYFNL